MFKEKDLAEIEAILQIMPDTFLHNHDEKLDLKKVQIYLENLLQKREQDFLESTLGHLSPRSIKSMLKVIHKISAQTCKESDQTCKDTMKHNNNTKELVSSPLTKKGPKL